MKDRGFWIFATIFVVVAWIGSAIFGNWWNQQEKEKLLAEEAAKEKVVAEVSIGTPIITDFFSVCALSLEEVPATDEYNMPQEGNSFYEIRLEVVNTTNNRISISTWIDISAYYNNTYIDEDYAAQYAANAENFFATLSKDRRAEGSLCYQLPKDWEILEVELSFVSGEPPFVLVFHNK